MRIPRPHHLFRQVIRMNRVEYTVERPVGSPSGEKNDFGGTPSESDPEEHTQYLWLYDPTHDYAQEEFGVTISGDLGGLAIPTEYEDDEKPDFDLQENDRINHGDQKYAVETITKYPNEDDVETIVIGFTRMEYEP